MADNIQDAVQEEINTYMDSWLKEFDVRVKAMINEATTPLVHHVFDTKGNGRGWKDNADSTVKRKGKNTPNIDSGMLEAMLSAPGFIQEDDYMSKLEPSVTMTTSGGKKVVARKPAGDYMEANKLRQFDNIGETEADESFVEAILERELKSEYQ